MSVDIQLLQVTPEDAKILANLSEAAFHTDSEIGGPLGSGGGPPGYNSAKAQLWFMKNLNYMKIILNNDIVGGLFYNSRKKGHFILERIFVDPQYHNRGIATQAMTFLFQKYPDTVWTLDTPEWNVRTRHFYEKLGFVQIGWIEKRDWRFIWYQRGLTKQISPINTLAEGMTEILVEGVIIRVTPHRKVKSKKDGKELSVAHMILQDNSGDITLVLWNEQITQVNLGDRIRVEFGKLNSYQGNLQLSIGFGRLIKLI